MTKRDKFERYIIHLIEDSVKKKIIDSEDDIPSFILELHAKYLFGLLGVRLLENKDISGIMADQRKSFDWTMKNAGSIASAFLQVARQGGSSDKR